MAQPSISSSERGVTVHWKSDMNVELVWRWIRDHDHGAASFHPITQQRQLAAESLTHAAAEHVSVQGDHLVAVWADQSTATIPLSFIAALAVPEPPTTLRLWDRAVIEAEWPTVSYDEIMDGDAGVAAWLDVVATYGFGFATGTPPTLAATEELVKRVGYIRETLFGGFWDFQADLSKADTAYTNLELLAHTDGTYSHDAPGLQMLHCVHFDGEGGHSTMSDGFHIAHRLAVEQPDVHRTLSTVPVCGQYIGDGHHLIARRPPLRYNDQGTLEQVSFNNADRAPMLLPADEMNELYDALAAFERMANEPAMQWRRVIRPGEAMLFDNWRVLHGRASYTGRRHLCGAYVNREEFESKRRLVSARSAVSV